MLIIIVCQIITALFLLVIAWAATGRDTIPRQELERILLRPPPPTDTLFPDWPFDSRIAGTTNVTGDRL